MTKRELRIHVRNVLSGIYGNWEMMQKKYGAAANEETLALAAIYTVGRIAGTMIPKAQAERWFKAGYSQVQAEEE